MPRLTTLNMPTLGLGALLLLLAAPASAAERAVDKGVVIRATVDEAWAAWTTRSGIVAFFAADARIEPRVGGAFQIHIDPGAPPCPKGAEDLRYLALQPKQMLSFTWNAPPSLRDIRPQRTFVVVRLSPVDAATRRVTLHHTG